MKNIILIILFIYTNCKTEKYYSQCLEGAASYDNKKHYLGECKKYSYIDSYCCLLTFKIEDIEHNYDFDFGGDDDDDDNVDYDDYEYKKNYDYKNISKYNKHRYLKGKEYTCFGLSKEGYYHISEVIKEVKKESEIDNVELDCFAKNLNLISLYLLLILFLFFLFID